MPNMTLLNIVTFEKIKIKKPNILESNKTIINIRDLQRFLNMKLQHKGEKTKQVSPRKQTNKNHTHTHIHIYTPD